MEFVRGGVQHDTQAREGTFTGEAWGTPLPASFEGIAMSTVYFTPGARTYWHSHERGQLLFITAGEGLIGTREETVRVRAGDIIWTPPGEEHWHGAADRSFLAHDTVSLGGASWLDEVSPEQYRRANSGASR